MPFSYCPLFCGFQSTLPRGERQPRRGYVFEQIIVSIHAPAGGATYRAEILRDTTKVSIHAPAGGATDKSPDIRKEFGVSIHAPAGGAT